MLQSTGHFGGHREVYSSEMRLEVVDFQPSERRVDLFSAYLEA